MLRYPKYSLTKNNVTNAQKYQIIYNSNSCTVSNKKEFSKIVTKGIWESEERQWLSSLSVDSDDVDYFSKRYT